MAPPRASLAPSRGNVWSHIALLVALGCALCMSLDIPPGLAVAWMPLTLFGFAAGLAGVIRGQRILWRAAAALSALFCLFASGALTLFLWLLVG